MPHDLRVNNDWMHGRNSASYMQSGVYPFIIRIPPLHSFPHSRPSFRLRAFSFDSIILAGSFSTLILCTSRSCLA
jgi:hypothetical protein